MIWITHMLIVDLNDNFSCKESKKKLRRSLIILGFVWGRFVNYSSLLFSPQMMYVTTHTWNSGTDMAISLLHFTTVFQGKDKSIERGENHYKSGHAESFSYAEGRNRELTENAESAKMRGRVSRKSTSFFVYG